MAALLQSGTGTVGHEERLTCAKVHLTCQDRKRADTVVKATMVNSCATRTPPRTHRLLALYAHCPRAGWCEAEKTGTNSSRCARDMAQQVCRCWSGVRPDSGGGGRLASLYCQFVKFRRHLLETISRNTNLNVDSGTWQLISVIL